ncbi:HNH endonuclease family protein [Streptomyces sp. NPDC017988]|uniref:HNH endonuclease family protein n=1 Tax=Streptomyces sp. NPDC017988 TaxID=3365025 RepID=UPI003795ACFC
MRRPRPVTTMETPGRRRARKDDFMPHSSPRIRGFAASAAFLMCAALQPTGVSYGLDAWARQETAVGIPRTPLPTKDEVKTMLATLDDVNYTPSEKYKRKYFKHWVKDPATGCTTRQLVLKRDAMAGKWNPTNCSKEEYVKPDGTRVVPWWFGVYDGKYLKKSDVDIDHVVTLENAWKTGASEWTSQRREQFANDRTASHQLVSVSAPSNRSKSRKAPDEWMPTLPSFRCNYVKMWVTVKSAWNLMVARTERAALVKALDEKTCR